MLSSSRIPLPPLKKESLPSKSPKTNKRPTQINRMKAIKEPDQPADLRSVPVVLPLSSLGESVASNESVACFSRYRRGKSALSRCLQKLVKEDGAGPWSRRSPSRLLRVKSNRTTNDQTSNQ